MDEQIRQIREYAENIYKMGESIDVEATARDFTRAIEAVNKVIEAANNFKDNVEKLKRR